MSNIEMTAQQWYERAIDLGLEWGAKALNNTEKSHLGDSYKSMHAALSGGFVWADMPEGSDYWSKAHSEACNKINDHERKPVTHKDWLKWAGRQGKSWAELAIACMISQNKKLTLNTTAASVADAIHGGFTWHKTDGGHSFWEKAYREARLMEWKETSSSTITEADVILVMDEMEYLARKPTTIDGWFKWAKAAGYSWADQALKHGKGDQGKVASLGEAVSGSFGWSDTEEGCDWWCDRYNEVSDDEWYAIDVSKPVSCTPAIKELKHMPGFSKATSEMREAITELEELLAV